MTGLTQPWHIVLILLIALLLFGGKRLPEIGRSLGKSLAEFKRASDDFKRTWEYEVELEHRKPALDTGAQENPTDDASAEAAAVSVTAADFDFAAGLDTNVQTVARNTSRDYAPPRESGAETAALQGGEDEDETNPS